MLKQRVIADQKVGNLKLKLSIHSSIWYLQFHEKQIAKQQKKFAEDKQLQEYHRLQMVKGNAEKKNDYIVMCVHVERYCHTKQKRKRS